MLKSRLLSFALPAVSAIVIALTFQNCGQPFRSGAHDHLSSIAAAKDCTPDDVKACSLNAGTLGTQTCGANEQWGSCVFDRCSDGFFQSGNLCLAMICEPDMRSACNLPGGSGMQTCASDGSALGACVADRCDAGFILKNGVCDPAICQPGQSYACTVTGGVGTKICNVDGQSYGVCNVTSCNSGYYQSGNTCVAQICAPNTERACAVSNGTGAMTCNLQGSAYGACMAVACNSGYDLVNGQCVKQKICTPNLSASCPIANGTGQMTCSSDGYSWGECELTSCNAGYQVSGNTCVAKPSQVCAPNSQQACSIANGLGLRTCNAAGSEWGECKASSCNAGYNVINDKCLRCTPSAMESCAITNGSGNRVCATDGLSWGQCQVSTCDKGYIKDGNACVPKPVCSAGEVQICTVTNGSGTQSCVIDGGSNSWGACVANDCNVGHALQNGQCLPYTSAQVESVDRDLAVDQNFYKKQFTVQGLPIIGSSNVRNQAFYAAQKIVEGMFAAKPNLWQDIRRSSAGAAYFIIIGENERTTQIPEYSHLGPEWDERARGFGGTWGKPVTSAGEENLLCLSSNRWYSSLAIHEMGHTVMNVALNGTPPFQNIGAAYNNAKASGLWANTYALTNNQEYFAVGSAVWFDAVENYGTPQGNGIFNHIWQRNQVISYDPALSNILDSTYGKPSYRWPRCN